MRTVLLRTCFKDAVLVALASRNRVSELANLDRSAISFQDDLVRSYDAGTSGIIFV